MICSSCSMTHIRDKCPACNWLAGWKQEDIEDVSMAHVGTALTPRDIWQKKKDEIAKQREAEGATKHHGVELPGEEISALRTLEDALYSEITPRKDGESPRPEQFAAKNGHVVELDLKINDYRAERVNFTELACKCSQVETLMLRMWDEKEDLAGLAALKSLKALLFGTRQYNGECPDAQLAVILSLAGLQELNIAGMAINPKLFGENIGKLKNLKKLRLASVRNINQFPDSMKELKALEEIDVTGTKLPGVGWPGWLAELPKLMLVHKDMTQGGLTFGKIQGVLEGRNPAAYPKASFKDKLKKGVVGMLETADPNVSPDKQREKWKESLPEPLKKGWSGIK